MPVTALPTVKLDNFEGPFDLLIELAREKELDLSEVSLTHITDSFLTYIQENKIHHEVQGDFLVVASTLLLLKVRQLLPRLTEEEEGEVAELTDRLRIYRLYREQADWMRQQWGLTKLFGGEIRGAPAFPTSTQQPVGFPSITTGQLAEAFSSLLSVIPQPPHPSAHLRPRGATLRECLNLFTARLRRVHKLVFQHVIAGQPKQDAAISFLAVLELARQGHIVLEQKTLFDTLVIRHTHES